MEFKVRRMSDQIEKLVLTDLRDPEADSIDTFMYYLERTSLYDTEKPYTMRYQPDEDIPQSNFKKIKYPMTAKSMRLPGSGPFYLNDCGFQLVELKSHLSYNEFWDNKRVKEVYIQEVKDTLKRELGAKYVHVLDYAVCRPQSSVLERETLKFSR